MLNIMASGSAVRTVRHVKPILSVDSGEAKKRVLNLYKAWYRQIPHIVKDFSIPVTVKQCRAQLREEFEQHKHVKDIRVIDMLVIKGQMELKETVEKWKQPCHVMTYFKSSTETQPKDFLSRFLAGQE